MIYKKIFKLVSNTLFPIKCALCKIDGEYLCVSCEKKLDLNYILDKNKQKIYGPVNNIGKENWIYAKYKYQNYNLKKLEYKIKYNHHPKLAKKLGEYSYEFIIDNIINKLKEKVGGNNLVGKIESQNNSEENNFVNIFLIPIPISKDRLKQRGYNQTEYVTEGILKEAENKMNPNLKILNILSRENTKKLKDIYGVNNRSEEMRNSMYVNMDISGGSEAATRTENKNNIYILIDDITTTGSTFYEARRALTEYGMVPENIYGYALSH